jgi:hypothetical protein
MYYSYVEIEYVATSFSPARMDLALKLLRHFLGMVEMLAPLTDLVEECTETKTTRMNKTKKKHWRWDPIHQQAFNNVKAAIGKETILAYPDFLKPFEIYPDASSGSTEP